MDYTKQIKPIVTMVCENYKSYAAASEATGVSAAYISRIMADDLKPKSVKPSTVQKLMNGLTSSQIEKIRGAGEDEIQPKVITDDQMKAWLESLSQAQREALITMIDMIPPNH